jgi:hypothetical protein
LYAIDVQTLLNGTEAEIEKAVEKWQQPPLWRNDLWC